MTADLFDPAPPAEPCSRCGATADLAAGAHWEQDGEDARVTYVWTCRTCLRADVRRTAAEQAAFWHAQAVGRSGDRTQVRESTRRVAESLRTRLEAFGAEPDEPTAEFIARYCA